MLNEIFIGIFILILLIAFIYGPKALWVYKMIHLYDEEWWIPGFPNTDYLAAGIYNQYICIDPITNVVIAKTSSNFKFNEERQYSKDAHVAIFRTIAQSAGENL
jgi:hypothetical protein|tara:strand:- start:471 stop:782 length:312 start_codon:yes stop_codon:yes gene_type:complete